MKTVKLPNGKTLTAETAANPRQRRKGLKRRKKLSQTHSMLFIYPGSEEREMWMKETYIPLDIIFLNEDKEIINIEKGQPLNKEKVRSSEPAKYVLEVNQGLAKSNNLRQGSKLHF